MKNVLIIEDDPMVALINKSYINLIDELNYIGCVTKEEELLVKMEEEKIDLIMLDVYLPGKNGLEILKTLRDKGNLIDIIIVTAANSRDDIKKAFAYGVIDYLVKPFEFDRFREAIERYLGRDSILRKNKEIGQQQIDSINSFGRDIGKDKGNLPKGLQQKTLEKIIILLEGNNNKNWTIREIAKETKISNVTVKKYMDYLEENKRVKFTPVYGKVGRPECIYVFIK